MIKEVKNISWAYDLPESKIHLACRSLDGFCEGWRDSTDLVISTVENIEIMGSMSTLRWGKFLTRLVKQIMRQYSWVSVHLFRLDHNGNANIYKDIKHITFTTLKFVDLSHNRLTSIEGICHLSMASLEIINLSTCAEMKAQTTLFQ